MSVDELLRTYASPVPALDPDAPLRSVHHRVRRRRLVRRGIAATAVVLALVAASAAAVRPHHDAQVTSNETGEPVHVAVPVGYQVVSDRHVAPENNVDRQVLTLYTGPKQSLLVTSWPMQDSGLRFEPVYSFNQTPGRVWLAYRDGFAAFVDAQLDDEELHVAVDRLQAVGDHLALPELPAWAERSDTSRPHPLDDGSLTRHQVVFRSGSRHVALDVVGGETSTLIARWRHQGRAVAGLGDADATLIVDRERRVGWSAGGRSFALRTDDPAIGDDELVAIARSVRVSG
jgi:hypothetical protein